MIAAATVSDLWTRSRGPKGKKTRLQGSFLLTHHNLRTECHTWSLVFRGPTAAGRSSNRGREGAESPRSPPSASVAAAFTPKVETQG